MGNVLTRKLEQFAPLSEDDRLLLDDVVSSPRSVPARTDLIAEDEPSNSVRLVVEGFACRYKSLKDGKRQIVGYLVPGDFCDLHAVLLNGMDHSIATLSECRIVEIPRSRILEMTERPALARAFWWATLVDEGTLREWLLNMGQRHATQRIGHLLCELYFRMRAVGLAAEGRFSLPLVQNDVADTVGLSLVHVNRCLQQLADMDILKLKLRLLELNDVERLKAFCGFNPNYLHLYNPPPPP